MPPRSKVISGGKFDVYVIRLQQSLPSSKGNLVRYALGETLPQMSESDSITSGSWWRTRLLRRVAILQQREDQVFLVLALVIGALTGLPGSPHSESQGCASDRLLEPV